MRAVAMRAQSSLHATVIFPVYTTGTLGGSGGQCSKLSQQLLGDKNLVLVGGGDDYQRLLPTVEGEANKAAPEQWRLILFESDADHVVSRPALLALPIEGLVSHSLFVEGQIAVADFQRLMP